MSTDPRCHPPETFEALERRLAAVTAERDELMAAGQKMLKSVCGETGFASAVRDVSDRAFPWPSLDIAEKELRAAIAKVQS